MKYRYFCSVGKFYTKHFADFRKLLIHNARLNEISHFLITERKHLEENFSLLANFSLALW